MEWNAWNAWKCLEMDGMDGMDGRDGVELSDVCTRHVYKEVHRYYGRSLGHSTQRLRARYNNSIPTHSQTHTHTLFLNEGPITLWVLGHPDHM